MTLTLPIGTEALPLEGTPLFLQRNENGALCLSDGTMTLCADLRDSLPRLRPDRLGRELLVKAARIKGFEGTPSIVDCTAGLGEDSLLLAAVGFEVTLFERDEVIAALLQDALRRAAEDEGLSPIVARMHLRQGDSIAGLGQLSYKPDVVFLDPMFPEKRKNAATKKKFQLLHHLEQPCQEEDALLNAALAAATRKVVVKRPAKGAFLAGVKPSYSIQGKAVRYDVIAL